MPTKNKTCAAAAAFADQLLIESGIAGVATFAGMAAGGVVSSLLRPAHENTGAVLTAVLYALEFAPPVLAGIAVDRRVRFSGGRTFDSRAGIWVAALGALIFAAAQLAAMAVENAPPPPASAGGGAILGYVAAADTFYLALGWFVEIPAIGMMEYGATKLVLRYLYRNHPNQPPRTRTARPPAIESLRLGGRR